ncbi:MAG: DEAD/DEAH box helicase family protein [Chitinispirillaceae bacterium]|nr:DEAD/DEAH box helicase family protein [Chitinispirillaceae bacterium]
MLIDNETRKVHEWFTRYTKNGNLDSVTGYFTVGALAFLSRQIKDRIHKFRFVLGGLASTDILQERPIDLLNDNHTANTAFGLHQTAREATEFIRQQNVEIKTLEPNFCHAKVYLFECDSKEAPDCWFVTGSSNLTEAGIGLKKTHNVELNAVGQGTDSDYRELREWFDKLWSKPQARSIKMINGNKLDYKDYLISEINKIYREYTPREIYYKILFELFGEQFLQDTNDPRFNRQVGRLENSNIYNALYEFQRKGALSLIRMLQKLNGAILADAVGLGKTWTALAVIKFFQLEGYEIILLCPKKLDHNWRKYLVKHNSRFDEDRFDYTIRHHSDLLDNRLEKKQDGLKINGYFRSDRPKLLVIDESHNLRNDKSSRYATLVGTILRQDAEIKVLMLTATPINNSLIDIRNQFKLITRGDSAGFHQLLGIRSIDHTFAQAQKVFNRWRDVAHRNIRTLINGLQPNFFKITDSLIVARTRKMIADQITGLTFPEKAKPDNEFVTPHNIGSFESFDELFDHFPPFLSAYQPSFYIEQEKEISALQDQRVRDRFLVKMMYILMVKRLESSWFSFKTTVRRILDHHESALSFIRAYEQSKKDIVFDNTVQMKLFDDESDDRQLFDTAFGRKQNVKISEIDKADKLSAFRKDLKSDIDKLDALYSNLERFEKEIGHETDKLNNHCSKDTKLEVLIKRINGKRMNGRNCGNRKVLIFTVYKDTAFYLYDQLKARGFSNIAVVSGDESRTYDSEHASGDFELILERFAPFTKLFLEKRWNGFRNDTSKSFQESFEAWKEWIKENDSHTYSCLQNPIDILISTDCLSEGQNLQDCDFVVNYDIHWNPVRIIQRMGRIDRLGSPNSIIFGLNFWPTDSINKYLDLQGRIEDRMTAMKLAGSEVDSRFTDMLREKAHDEEFERKLTARMLEQMQVTWEDIETNDANLGFNDLSLELFRQDLALELSRSKSVYDAMPRGIYSGFKDENPGLIALLGYPARKSGIETSPYHEFDLIYIDYNGKTVILNQKDVLDFISRKKDVPRFVPVEIDAAKSESVQKLTDALKTWLGAQVGQVYETGQTITMGESSVDILQKLKSGDATALKQIRRNITSEEKYDPDNCDLITWLAIS